MSETFTQTETLRRLRVLTARSREVGGLPRNARVEIGCRLRPVATDHVPSRDECYPEDDDLRTFYDLPDAAKLDEVRRVGAVVHVYLSEPRDPSGFGGELVDVNVGWIGTEDQEPVLVDYNGRRLVGENGDRR